MNRTEIAVVGSGPVGLLLALRLHDLGFSPTVIERRELDAARDARGSRSIGIHPPSLELLDALGVGDELVQQGVKVRCGRAFAGRRPIGKLDFGACGGRHRYVLSVPQTTTEEVLREALQRRLPGALRDGQEVVGLRFEPASIELRLRRTDGSGQEERLDAGFVVACDGRRSACRTEAGIAFVGDRYPGSYLMGDAPDTTSFGWDAAVFLSERGLVESFPLPGGWRRWVLRRRDAASEQGPQEPDAIVRELVGEIEARTGHALIGEEIRGASRFSAERFVAERLTAGRLVLAGDAAHVVSPIGGQGMNLGWMSAWATSEALCRAVLSRRPTPDLELDAQRRLRLARTVSRRAELNMWLGRPTRAAVRDLLVRALLARPLADALARVFTMRGLALGI